MFASGASKLSEYYDMTEKMSEKMNRPEIQKSGSAKPREIQYTACKYSTQRTYFCFGVRITTMPSPAVAASEKASLLHLVHIPFSLLNVVGVCALPMLWCRLFIFALSKLASRHTHTLMHTSTLLFEGHNGHYASEAIFNVQTI